MFPKPFCLWVLALALLALSACANFEAVPALTPSEIALQEATQLTQLQRYTAASGTLQTALTQDYNNLNLWLALGQVYLRQGRWDLAQNAFLQVTLADDSHYQANLGLAQALYQQGLLTEAETVWAYSTTLAGATPSAWEGLGLTHLALGAYGPAQRAFNQAIEQGDSPLAHWYLAAFTLPEDREAGQVYLTQMAELPQTATQAANLSATPPLISPAELTARREYLQSTLSELDDEAVQAEVAVTVGIALVQLEAWSLAWPALTLATARQPSEARAWVFLGYTEHHLGQQANASFQRARELDPDLALTPYFEALTLRQAGDYQLALDKFLLALELDPENLAISLETALTLAAMGDYLSAEAWFQALAEAEPDQPEYQQFLTAFYVERSYLVREKGLSAAETLVERQPEAPRAYELLGWAQFQVGQYATAEESLRQALALDSGYIPARYRLGRVFQHQNRTTEALREFTHVVDWDRSGVYRQRVFSQPAWQNDNPTSSP